MLVLGRSQGEALIIGDRAIKITVLSIDRGQVRLGVDAPRHIPVHREEVLERIEKEGKKG